MYKKRFSTKVSAAPEEVKSNATTVPVELPPDIDIYSQENTNEHSLWWDGVKEISIYLNEENAAIVNSHFTSIHRVVFVLFYTLIFRPRRKVILALNPQPTDCNEYGPFMGNEVELRVVALIQDEHAQVLLLTMKDTPAVYYYPNLVLSCENETPSASYSPIYGRLLVDRAVKAGLLTKEDDAYVPLENTPNVENVEVPEYFTYPTTHISVKDMRNEEIVFHGRLCTSRGMDCQNDM